MEYVRQAAFLSIGRAVGFAGFAIFTVMVSLSFEPLLALKTGGVLLLVLIAALLLRAQQLPFVDHRHTEAWALLDSAQRPNGPAARDALVAALRDACFWFARWIAGAAAVIWAFSLFLTLVGFGSVASA